MLPELEPRVQELNEHFVTFKNYLHGLDEQELITKDDNSSWSPRNTVAHLIGAELSMLRMAKNWIAGVETKANPEFDLNFFNRRQQEKRTGQSLDELLEDWGKAQKALIELMETVKAEDLVKRGDHPRAADTTLANLFVIITTHEAEHLGEVMDAHSQHYA